MNCPAGLSLQGEFRYIGTIFVILFCVYRILHQLKKSNKLYISESLKVCTLSVYDTSYKAWLIILLKLTLNYFSVTCLVIWDIHFH